MFDLKWSASEKKVSRDAYDAVLKVAEAKLVAEFKARANTADSFADVWAVERYLHEERVFFADMFDYRYSRLPLFFAWAIRKGHMDEKALTGLSEDKLEKIRSLAATQW